MKKTFTLLLATAALLGAFSATADDSLSPYEPNGPRFKTTYWGAEASQKPNNPCKGATIRKCAEIDTQLTQKTGHVTVITTFINENGIVSSPTSQNYNMTMEQVIQKLFQDLPENAEIEQLN